MGGRSELVALEISDVTETPEGLEVLIRASKTDQEALGAVVAIPKHGQHVGTDPVRLVRAWLARLTEHGIPSGRVLRSVTRHGLIGGNLSTDAIGDVVQVAAVGAELPEAQRYSAHSLRRRCRVGVQGGCPGVGDRRPRLVGTGLAGGAELRPGRRPVAGQRAARNRALSACAPSSPPGANPDGAGPCHDIIDHLTALNTAAAHGNRGPRVEYSIGWPADEPTMAGIGELRESDWGNAFDADGLPDPEAQVAELTGILPRRARRGPSRHVAHRPAGHRPPRSSTGR